MNKKVRYNQEEALEAMRTRLHRLRKKAHYTQAELGTMLGISAQTVSSYENGTIIPGPEVLLCYCDIFKCDCNYLMHGIEETMETDKISLRADEKQMLLAYRHCEDWKKKALLSLAHDSEIN
ncbi:MAG: helix-turn-helix transcriptional regulator [Solobacterium sp.]|nr:helix-turn-helix transcriptional regulator [Solobacterium sp.]